MHYSDHAGAIDAARRAAGPPRYPGTPGTRRRAGNQSPLRRLAINLVRLAENGPRRFGPIFAQYYGKSESPADHPFGITTRSGWDMWAADAVRPWRRPLDYTWQARASIICASFPLN